MEFQEFRDYQAGDDLRHIDWRAYARTETLTTRLYREEVAATVELIIDGSRSMALHPEKQLRLHELAAFLAGASSYDASLHIFHALDTLVPIELSRWQAGENLRCDGKQSLATLPLAGALRAGTVRVVLSDFLFPCDTRALINRLRGRAHRLLLLQLLDASEHSPHLQGNVRLLEAETGHTRELPVDEGTVRRYLGRLDRHCRGLAEEAQRSGAVFLQLDASKPLDTIVRQTLIPAEVVESR
ncbi:MAG: DUF58 domain-containing protein [Planctomycetes bacterium]|nr:DUF58 domain-containing protein [Planctomycetota bacterium]